QLKNNVSRIPDYLQVFVSAYCSVTFQTVSYAVCLRTGGLLTTKGIQMSDRQPNDLSLSYVTQSWPTLAISTLYFRQKNNQTANFSVYIACALEAINLLFCHYVKNSPQNYNPSAQPICVVEKIFNKFAKKISFSQLCQQVKTR
ncbi:MAG: hypothetical protein IKO34_13455, partial [Bacteroidales bacterium]|nr:hypothetical protein [Bacteroidales bacterium]